MFGYIGNTRAPLPAALVRRRGRLQAGSGIPHRSRRNGQALAYVYEDELGRGGEASCGRPARVSGPAVTACQSFRCF
jgi:hypothetical protein